MDYGTVTEIFQSARSLIPMERSASWPTPTEQLSVVNTMLVHAQRRTGYKRKTTAMAYITPWKSYALTTQTLDLFIPIWAKIDGDAGVWVEVVSMEDLLAFRKAAYATATKPYIAFDKYPTTFGSINAEICPAFTINTTVNVYHEDAPTKVTDVDDVVEMPRDVMEAGIAWKMAIGRAPQKADYFYKMYTEAAKAANKRLRTTGRIETGVVTGFMADIGDMFG